MKRTQFLRRFLSLALVAAMLAVYAVPAGAAQPDVLVEKVSNDSVSASLLDQRKVQRTEETPYADEDMVRVSIVMKDDSTIEAGYSTMNIGQNAAAMAYRNTLAQTQKKVAAKIESAISGKLDVVWNLTLAANLISANVAYGDIKAIEKVPGVEKVVLETRYDPQEATTDAAANPNMAVSSQMVGSSIAWQSGLTGAGRRIAIIDTGLDLDHQSVSPDALAEAYRQNAEAAGVSYEDYVASLDLLDKAEINSLLPQLNVTQRFEGATADMIYQNLKAPFGYNYIDNCFYLTHDEDDASEHGSHVAGISAANRLIEKNGSFVNAAETVGVVGNAPDAQIIVMKVFGKAGGAYDSDYMAAIEDAVVLGCDSANLSLGSAAAGFVNNEMYQDILDGLTDTDTVVSISAGNNGYWAEKADHIGLPYVDAPNFHTGGSPGTYKNSLGVASVDNDGGVGNVLRVGDGVYMFSENQGNAGEYTNKPIASLDTTEDGSGVTLDYVFVNAIGNPEDYEGIDLTGKVAFCVRGGITFSEKANNAAALGAAAIIVCNNQPGVINMNLADYTYDKPCVSITLADAESIMADSVPSADGSYLTGEILISSKLATVLKNSDHLTMSAFSSWGAPGNLSMKPEITAPGGGVYSINGALADTDKYELMSGTSMAAPQISGISALVLQYIEENGLSQPGMTNRALAQSLMMSTATPLVNADPQGNEYYYSVLQQGAGLVNTAAATSADSFVIVDGTPDGKVKAELGDDPDRDGVYNIVFTLNNLTDKVKTYALNADLFTQNLVVYYPNADAAEQDDQDNLAMFFDTATMDLDNSLTTWTVNGAAPSGDPALDFNGDGKADKLDAQMILDYTTGLVEEIPEAADINADGSVTSYDAHLMLEALSADSFAVVPASGSAIVSVTLTLTESDKEVLDSYCTAGAYVEAYIYADAIADEEGVIGTSHSIPVLGYYGNWSDASMFDIGSYAEYASGEEIRTPYLFNPNANSFGVVYADTPNDSFYFGGNPLLPDLHYLRERDAINANDSIYDVSFTAIRNAGASRVTMTNETTGEIIDQYELGPVMGAFYNPNSSAWSADGNVLNLDFVPSMLQEDERLSISLELAPEYYMDIDGTVNWDALTDGARFTMSAVIDNTAPEVIDAKLNEAGDQLLVNASDNQYISAVVLMNAAGNNILSMAPALEEVEAGSANEYALDVAGLNGRSFMLVVSDYAMNLTTYRINFQIGEPQPMPELIAFHNDLNFWFTPKADVPFDPWYDDPYAVTDKQFISATIADHVVLGCTLDGMLYAMPEYDLTYETPVAKLDSLLVDMAYNASDGEVYALDVENDIYAVDKYTGAMTLIGRLPIDSNTLACDSNGTFYFSEYESGHVYSFTLETLAEPVLLTTVKLDGKEIVSEYLQSMEADPDTGKLCWMSYFAGDPYDECRLVEIDTADGTYTMGTDQLAQIGCLLIPAAGEGGDWTEPVEEATGVQILNEMVSVLKGSTVQMEALVQPWTAADRSVVWSSDNEAVATVNQNGIVTGVSGGTATITAASVLNPAVTASCEVTVDTLQVTLNGILQGNDGKPVFFDWNMADDDTWTAGASFGTTFASGTYDPIDNVYFAMDDSSVNAIHKIAADGTNVESYTNTAGVPLWDMTYSPVFSQAGKPIISSIYGYYLLPAMDPAALSTAAFNLGGAVDLLTAVTTFGADETDVDGVMTPCEHIVMLDNAGQVLHMYMFPDGDNMSANLEIADSDLKYKFDLYDGDVSFTNMVVGDDGNLYLSAFNGSTNVLYRLVYNGETRSYESTRIGSFGQDIWPAVLMEVTSNETAAANAYEPRNLTRIDAVPVTAEELSAADSRAAQTGSLNAAAASAAAAAPAHVFDDVTVDIKASDVATNGLYTFAMDSSLLSFKQVRSDMDLVSANADGDSITLAFANELEVPADTVVAQLVLTANHYHIHTALEPTVVEYNDQTPNAAADPIPVDYDNCPSAAFEDVDTSKWYHEAVDYVVCNKVMKGVEEDTFGVYNRLDRAQLATILYRLAGAPAVNTVGTFQDVSDHAYFVDAVEWAAANGIVKGEVGGTFDPYRPITRAEMVTMLYRFAAYEGCDVSARADLSVYADEVPGFAQTAMSWAVASGVVRGTSSTTLEPNATASRAQAASVIYNYMTKLAQ